MMEGDLDDGREDAAVALEDVSNAGANRAQQVAWLWQEVPVPVIASGGIGHPKHFVSGVVEGHASAVLAASIFHFGDFTISEAKQIMQAAGIEVRL